MTQLKLIVVTDTNAVPLFLLYCGSLLFLQNPPSLFAPPTHPPPLHVRPHSTCPHMSYVH
jgi:hypothetical protein